MTAFIAHRPRPRALLACIAAAFLASTAALLGAAQRDYGDGLIRLAAPERFTADDQRTLDETMAALKDVHERLATHALSEQQRRVMSDQEQRYAREIMALRDRKRIWNEYENERNAASAQDAAIGRGGPPVRAPFDYARFYRLTGYFNRSEDAFRRELEQTPNFWLEGAGALLPFADMPFRVEDDAVAPYVLRAALLAAKCRLYASVVSHRLKKPKDAAALRAQAVAELLRIVRIEPGGDAARIGFLPSDHPDAPDKYAAFDGCRREEHDISPNAGAFRRLEDPRAGFTQAGTFEKARELLADYCPWGLGVYSFLDSAHMAELIDAKILRPYSSSGGDKLHESPLRKGVPLNIARDIRAIAAGDFEYRGNRVMVEWVVPPKATCSIWFISPRAYDFTAGEIAGLVLKAVKALKTGPLDLLADETMDLLLKHVELMLGPDSMVYGASGLLVTANNMGYDSDFVLDGKPFSGYKLVKETLTWAISLFEKAEAALLFEALDPRQKELADFSGRPIGYDGSNVPPIIIRADLLGFEKMPDHRYPRCWHVVRYYQLDARAVAGVPSYNLREHPSDAIPGAPAYLAGDIEAHERTWPLLPITPKPWGCRAYVTDFSPQGQVIAIAVGGERLDAWRKSLAPGEVLAAAVEDALGNVIAVDEMRSETWVLALCNERIHVENRPLRAVVGDAKAIERLDMHKRYTVRFLAAEKSGDTLRIAWQQDEKDKVVVSFAAKQGTPFLGRLSSPHPGWVRADVDLVAPYVAREDASSGVLLPPRLFVDGVAEDGQQIVAIVPGNYRHRFRIALAPAEPGWNTVIVRIRGSVYFLHDKPGRLGAAAVFDGELPLLPGLNEVKVSSAAAAKPVMFAVESGPAYAREYWRVQKEIDECMARVGRAQAAGDAAAHVQALLDAAEVCIRKADEMNRFGEYIDAADYARDALKRLPDPDDVSRTGGRSDFYAEECDNAARRAAEALMHASFGASDAQDLYTAGMRFFQAERMRIESGAAPRPSDYNALAEKCAVFARRCIMTGVEPAGVGNVVALYAELRRRGGSFDAEFDMRQFRYPEGGGR
ncbi:MAG TPA: hypothetical protein DCM87_12065 [Planctomycetes bacterium]|nr:hypothetical protein [Planctomycetota bacterium]